MPQGWVLTLKDHTPSHSNMANLSNFGILFILQRVIFTKNANLLTSIHCRRRKLSYSPIPSSSQPSLLPSLSFSLSLPLSPSLPLPYTLLFSLSLPSSLVPSLSLSLLTCSTDDSTKSMEHSGILSWVQLGDMYHEGTLKAAIINTGLSIINNFWFFKSKQ